MYTYTCIEQALCTQSRLLNTLTLTNNDLDESF